MQRGKCRKSGWGLQDEPLLAWRAWPGATLLALLQPRSWRVRAGRRAGRKALHRWGKCGLQTAHPKPAARASPAECPAGGSGLAGAPGQPVLQGGRVGGAWPGLQGGRGQHTPGGGWVHLRTAGVPGPRTWRRREVRGAHPDLVPTWRSPRPCARRRGHGGAHASVFSSCVFTFFFF